MGYGIRAAPFANYGKPERLSRSPRTWHARVAIFGNGSALRGSGQRRRSRCQAADRGSDRAEEVALIGAHLDFWTGGTGATDNAAGAAVMMEAMRILKVAGLPMRRTVRIALWSGEEQGMLGSRAYVDQHLVETRASREGGASIARPGAEKFSAYFNLDRGAGAIRGIDSFGIGPRNLQDATGCAAS